MNVLSFTVGTSNHTFSGFLTLLNPVCQQCDPNSITSQQCQRYGIMRPQKKWFVGMKNWNPIESTYSELVIDVASFIQAQEYENSTFCFISSLMLITTLQKGKSFPFVMWQTFLVNSHWADVGLFKIRCTSNGHSLSSWISYSFLINLSDNLSIVYSKSAAFILFLSVLACQTSILMYLDTSNVFPSLSQKGQNTTLSLLVLEH